MVKVAQLHRLQLTNIRTFPSLDISFNPPKGKGQWIVLLGNNGSGKSTILRSIAMALAEPRSVTRFLEDSNSSNRFVRSGLGQGEIYLETDAGMQGRFLFRSAHVDHIESAQNWDEEDGRHPFPYELLPFVAGYGSLRGTGMGSYKSSRGATDTLASLFLPDSPLADPEQWLQHNKLRQFEDSSDGRYDKIIEIVCNLLPGVDNLDVTSAGVEAVFENGTQVPFKSLSDGYLTTAAWVLDMIAAWLDTHEEIDPGLSIAEQMTGIVLVDEIDLHLHPIWQRQVISEIRSSFPNMTFIVTTHSPLTVMDAQPGELFVVDQAEVGGTSTVSQIDLRPGDVSEILTGAWFNLGSSLDTETTNLMEKHRAMLAEGISEKSPKRKTLETKLRKRLDGFGVSSVDSMVQGAANEIILDSLKVVNDSSKQSAKDALMKLVKERR